MSVTFGMSMSSGEHFPGEHEEQEDFGEIKLDFTALEDLADELDAEKQRSRSQEAQQVARLAVDQLTGGNRLNFKSTTTQPSQKQKKKTKKPLYTNQKGRRKHLPKRRGPASMRR